MNNNNNNNNNPSNNHYDPDDDSAHYAAYNRMAEEYRNSGQLNCADYLIEYHNQIGERPPSSSPELIEIFDAMPTIRSNLQEMDLLCQAFERSNLDIPIGVHDLPLTWGRAIRELMLDTHWLEFSQCKIENVFGWSSAFRFGSFLHICFSEPFPPNQSHWCEIGSLIHELHRRFEPGPYTPLVHISDFLV